MPDIRVLPRHLVNKIAAGEVIERPASVVKELVENALDAAASTIDVTVADGGRKLISVRDDGLGMGPEDLELAVAPHATSKIADEQDLAGIHTMGFRGEALASIVSVSQASILSRPRGSGPEAAHEIRAEGEKVLPVRPASAPEGTTVVIGNLFFNTPARRKFMRAASTEFGHVVEQLARLSLPHPQTAFSLTHNDRCTHRLPPADGLRRRVADLFGAELAESLIEFSDRGESARIFGLAGPPAVARASARWQYTFVNGRYVRDRTLSHAIREAFRGLVDPARSPVAFVFLEMDPQEVDVNVHPAKIEVRFRRGQMLHSQLLAALREALNRSDLAPGVEIDHVGPAPAEPEDQRRHSLKQALADFFKSQPAPQTRLDFPPARSAGRPQPGGHAADYAPTSPGPTPAGGTFVPERPAPPPPAPRRQAFQLHDSYIVAATDDGVAIIDQHALHERIIYEDLRRRLDRGNLDGQRLLVPETVEVAELEKVALLERADLLERLGTELTEFGPHSLAVQKFPALLAQRGLPAAEFLRDLLDVLADHDAAGDPEVLLSRLLAALACRAAVKAGQRLSDEEIQALLDRRGQVERSASCPHGRPTTLTLSRGELEKQFKRT